MNLAHGLAQKDGRPTPYKLYLTLDGDTSREGEVALRTSIGGENGLAKSSFEAPGRGSEAFIVPTSFRSDLP